MSASRSASATISARAQPTDRSVLPQKPSPLFGRGLLFFGVASPDRFVGRVDPAKPGVTRHVSQQPQDAAGCAALHPPYESYAAGGHSGTGLAISAGQIFTFCSFRTRNIRLSIAAMIPLYAGTAPSFLGG